MSTWRDARRDAQARLRDAGIETADAEARWLIEEVSGYDGAELVAEEGEPATERGLEALAGLLERRLAGEPIQYVLGHWAFRDLDLLVDPRVLIPRPETELVVEFALEEAVRLGARRAKATLVTGEATFRALDLGTGSGAIALALASELPQAHVWAVECSEPAAAVARANVAGNGTVGVRVTLLEGSWFEPLEDSQRGSFELIVSNPPYLADAEIETLDRSVRAHEPHGALAAGETGLEAIQLIVAEAPNWLTPEGALVVELAPQQADTAVQLATAAGFASAEVRWDLAGRARVLIARRRAEVG